MNLKDYSTDELLLMANNVMNELSEQEVCRELYRRGINDKVIAGVMKEREEIFMQRLNFVARVEQIRKDRWNEKNHYVSYRWWEMLFLFVLAPFYIVKPLRHLVGSLVLLPICLLSRIHVNLNDDLFVELRRFKKEKYDCKFRQRLFLLISGDLCCFFYAWLLL